MSDLEDTFNLTNKRAHPTNAYKIVYRFARRDQAERFAELLVSNNVEFEAQEDQDHAHHPIYFGVARHLEKRVDRLNFLALGHNREKFIASAPMRWIILGITIAVMLLAILGALKS